MSRSRPAWPPRTRWSAWSARPATTSSSPTTRTAAPTACSSRSSSPGASTTRPRRSTTPPRSPRPSSRARPRSSGSRRRRNPLLGVADIPAIAADRPRCGRDPRRRQHVRDAVPPAPAHPRRRRRRALDDQVRRRSQRRRRRCDRHRRTQTSATGSRPSRTPPAPPRDRSTPTSCCAGSRPSPCGWTGTATTPSGSSTSSRHHDAVGEIYYPGLTDHPGHQVAARADEAVRRHGVVPGEGRAPGGARRVQPRPGLHARRVARRRRVPDRAAGDHDARVGRGLGRSRCPTTWSGSRSGWSPSTT